MRKRWDLRNQLYNVVTARLTPNLVRGDNDHGKISPTTVLRAQMASMMALIARAAVAIAHRTKRHDGGVRRRCALELLSGLYEPSAPFGGRG